jgi:very-short-patch-repair endonuclease
MKLCQCGCGEEVSKEIYKYKHGHYFRGKKRGKMLEKHKEKIRNKVIEIYKDEKIRNKQKENTKRGEDHPCYGKECFWRGKHLPEDMKRKIGESQQGNKHHMFGKKHKAETIERIKSTTKSWWNSEEGKKQRLKQMEKMNNGQAAYCNSFIKSPSKPQVLLFEQVKKLYITSILNYQFFNYSLDIAIPEKRIDIEYNGSYWHDKNSDLIRQNYLKKHHWKILRYKDYIPTFDQLKMDLESLEREDKKL